MSNRREFLKFLAGSPLLLAYPALLEAFTQAPTALEKTAEPPVPTTAAGAVNPCVPTSSPVVVLNSSSSLGKLMVTALGRKLRQA